MASPQANTAALKGRSALICGSVAFDTIMVFSDRFKNHILPDKIHMLNVSFLVPQMRRENGGTAGNIAYGLKLLGDRGYAMATVGHDFAPYREWMTKNGVPTDHIKVIDSEHTPRPSSPLTWTTIRSPRSIPARCSPHT